jgi:hypothetical protein
MGASGNFLTAVGRVTSRGAMVKEIAASGDAAYNQNAVTGGSLMELFDLTKGGGCHRGNRRASSFVTGADIRVDGGFLCHTI